MVDVGRNDPCPCGSGRKYKQCCLGKIPASFTAEVRERAWKAVTEFALRKEFAEQRAGLQLIFFGPEIVELPLNRQQIDFENEQCMLNLLFWLIYEASFDGPSRTLVNLFLSRRGHTLPLSDRRYLEAMRGSHLHLYEVEAVTRDVGLRLRDCWSDERFDIRERLFTQQAVPLMVAALRLRRGPNGDHVIDEYDGVMETDGNSDDRFAFYHGVVIAQHVIYNMLLRPAPTLTRLRNQPHDGRTRYAPR